MKLMFKIFEFEVSKVFKNDQEKCMSKLYFGLGKFGHDLVHVHVNFMV